ncbi:MAG: purine-nucleoside phosphorylase [Pseudomonadota bacterium]
MDSPGYEQIAAAAAFVRERISLPPGPRVGVVLGSGLGAFADQLDKAQALAYAEIPHFPQGSVSGHKSQLVVGSLGGTTALVMQGRVHMYEGYSPQQVVFPVRVLMELGARVLILTNAAGGLGDGLQPGDLMLIRDHINLSSHNPLVGANDDRLGPRFPDMSDTYSRALRELASKVAARRGLALKSGVYLGLLGPSYETPAEIRMFQRWGVDAVGMSTVPEAIACGHRGVPVLGISCITNLAAGISSQPLNHDEVKETADRVTSAFVGLLQDLVPEVGQTLG